MAVIVYTFTATVVKDVRDPPLNTQSALGAEQYPTSGISGLPGVFATATSWLVCEALWPDRASADAPTAEIHFSVHADHSLSTVDDLSGALRERGIFAATLFAQQPGPLTWLRPHSAFSVDYVGLRWVVPRASLETELERLAAAITDLAGEPPQRVASPEFC